MSVGFIVFLSVVSTLGSLAVAYIIYLIISIHRVLNENMDLIDRANSFLSEFMQQQREAMEMERDEEDEKEGRISL